MKRTIMILSLLLFVVAGTMAQDGRQGGQRPNREEFQKQQMETMKKELKLTPDQITKVEALNAETGKKMEALFANSGEDRSQMREKSKAVRDESDKKLKTILTPEQFTKWQEIQTKMREERRANRPEGQGRDQGNGQRGGQRGGGTPR